MSRLAVFAYGSLVSQASFQQTLGRRPGQWELFLKTTEEHPGEAIEPLLVRDLIPHGNTREW